MVHDVFYHTVHIAYGLYCMMDYSKMLIVVYVLTVFCNVQSLRKV
jgi:hypothetical protein